MKAACTLTRTGTGDWLARHSSPELGDVELTAPSPEEVLNKLRRELQYRLEWCPCSGMAVGTVELDVCRAGEIDHGAG